MTAHEEVGAYEAKTHLPAILRKVRAGKRFTITQRGTPIAELIPYGAGNLQAATAAARAMHEFMQSHPPISDVDTKTLMEEGRD